MKALSQTPGLRARSGRAAYHRGWQRAALLLGLCAGATAVAAAGNGGFAPPSGDIPAVSNPARVAPEIRNAPADPTRVEIRNHPSHPVNRQLRLTAPEIATPTPGVPPPARPPRPPVPPPPAVPPPLLNH